MSSLSFSRSLNSNISDKIRKVRNILGLFNVSCQAHLMAKSHS